MLCYIISYHIISYIILYYIILYYINYIIYILFYFMFIALCLYFLYFNFTLDFMKCIAKLHCSIFSAPAFCNHLHLPWTLQKEFQKKPEMKQYSVLISVEQFVFGSWRCRNWKKLQHSMNRNCSVWGRWMFRWMYSQFFLLILTEPLSFQNFT